MASTGWTIAGTGANNADAGDKAWSNPGNATNTDDAQYAGVGDIPKSTGTSQYLHMTNFGLSVPSGATIDGIEARVRGGSAVANQIADNTIQLIVGGSRAGANNASATKWPTYSNRANADYGGASNLWSLSPTRADVVASNFGLAVRVTQTSGSGTGYARVYSVWLNVHYTEATGNTGAFFALFSVRDRLREILKPRRRFWMPEPAFA